MNDASISRTLPSTVQIKGVTTGSVTQSDSNIPPAIAKLSHGSTLSGFVINRDAHGNATLRTDQGDLSIKSELFLKTGSEVVIRIEHSAQQVKANIITVDGLTLSQLKALQDARAVRNDTILQPSLAPKDAPVLSPSQTQASGATIPLNSTTLNITHNTNSTSSSKTNLPISDSTQASAASATTKNAHSNLQLTQSTKAGIILNAVVLQPSENAANILKNILPSFTASITTGNVISVQLVSTELPEATVPIQATLKNATPPPTDTKTTAQQYSNYAKQISLSTTSATTITSPPTILHNTNNSGVNPIITPNAQSTHSSSTQSHTTPQTPASPKQVKQIPPSTATGASNTANINAVQSKNDTTSVHSNPATQSTPSATSTTSLPSTTANTSASNTLLLTVIGQERDGKVIAQSDIGTLRIFTASPLPVGSKLTVDIMQYAPSTSTTSATALSATATSSTTNIFTQSGKQWPQLEHIIEQLPATAPATAEALIRNIIPNIGNRFVTATLFFVSALKGGDIRNWISTKHADTIEKSLGSEALQRLSNDFGAIRTLFTERPDGPQSQQWQTLFLPFFAHDKQHHAHIYIRNEEHNDAQDTSPHGTRFIVEVSLSHLGELQLDGLVRSQENSTRFDLFVRTTRSLDATIQKDIQTIFSDAAQITGTSGNIEFISSPTAMVRPQTDSSNDAEHSKGILA